MAYWRSTDAGARGGGSLARSPGPLVCSPIPEGRAPTHTTARWRGLHLVPGGGLSDPLPWFGPRFVLKPQGQILWQQLSFKDANDSLGPVGLGTTGRLGMRGKWTIAGANGVLWQPYVRANVWRDWGAEATTMFGIDPVPLIGQSTRLEFAGGVRAKLSPNWSSPPRAAISSPPVSPATASAATASRATSA